MTMKQKLSGYRQYLEEQELAESTIRTYMRQTKELIDYVGRKKLTKQLVIGYKEMLAKKGYCPSTVNLSIVAVNRFLRFCGAGECTVKTKKQQRRQSLDHVLNEDEYRKLLEYAWESGRTKYYLIMKTMALTGIRVSELKYITHETLQQGYAVAHNKGKTREIYLPDCLVAPIKEYCREESIEKGAVFLGSSGHPISRTAVWKMFHHLADMVGIDSKKAYPHSFRHFFALSYMKQFSNIFELADILGHSSLETTRIYTTATIEQKRERIGELDRLFEK